jgi:hypothetical protein
LRVSFNSTEEQSSRRREQTRAIGEPEAELARAPGKELPGEPEAEPARGPGKELRMRIENEVWKRTGNGTWKGIGDETRKGIGEGTRKGTGSETHAALRKLAAANGTRKLLQRNVMTGYGRR